MIQEQVWTVSIVLMGALAAVFAWVAAGANVALADYGPAVDAAYRLRSWLFTLVFLILVAGTYQTLGRLPYVSRQGQLPVVGVQRVDAVSEQWSWTVTPTEFVVGQTVPWELESSLSVNTPLLMRLANITGGHLFDRYEDIFHVESSILGAVDMWP